MGNLNNKFSDLNEVVNAFFNGEVVHWKSTNYAVADWGSKGHKGKRKNLVVKCLSNGSGIGLFHADVITSDHKPEEFFVVT